MDLTIWKYELKAVDEQDITMPRGARILTVQAQYGTAHLWAMVTPDSKPEKRKIHIRRTGDSTSSSCSHENYIGTFQLEGGELVFHVFAD